MKIQEIKINNNIASGIINGLIYRVNFDAEPTKKEARQALKEAASYFNKSI